MIFLKVLLPLFLASSVFASSDLQTELTVRLNVIGVILVRNDSPVPLEIPYSQTGKILFCLKQNQEDYSLYPVTKKTFPRGEVAVLVYCRNGLLLFNKGYI